MKTTLLLIPAAALLLVSCGDNKVREAHKMYPDHPNFANLATFAFGADTLLAMPAADIRPESAIEVIRADALAADTADSGITLAGFDCVGVASADYAVAGKPIRAEIAQFAEPIDAYGYYAAHRPNGAPTELIGRQSFRIGGTRYVYTGDYAMTFSALDESDSSVAALDRLAKLIADKVTVQAALTPYHILFPGHDRVPGSDRFFGYRWMNVRGLNEIYTMDFMLGTDTSTWFVSPDSSGAKYLIFKDWAEDGGKRLDVPPIFKFDQGFSTYVEHQEYGRVMAGLVKGKLVGVIGYRPEFQEQKTSQWITGLGM